MNKKAERRRDFYPAESMLNQPFGSIPRCWSSLRIILLSHAALETHHHLAVALVPSSLEALDQAEIGMEDCLVSRFCVLTRQLHPM